MCYDDPVSFHLKKIVSYFSVIALVCYYKDVGTDLLIKSWNSWVFHSPENIDLEFKNED